MSGSIADKAKAKADRESLVNADNAGDTLPSSRTAPSAGGFARALNA